MFFITDRIILQVIYFSSTVSAYRTDPETLPEPCNSAPTLKIRDVPLPTWLLILWPLPLMGLNEMVKHYEIKYIILRINLHSILLFINHGYLCLE